MQALRKKEGFLGPEGHDFSQTFSNAEGVRGHRLGKKNWSVAESQDRDQEGRRWWRGKASIKPITYKLMGQ